MSLVWGFSQSWSLVGRYLYYDNSSNKSFFEYTRGVGTLGVNWYF